MGDMFKDKGLIIGIVITTILIAGGIFLFTKNTPQTGTPTGTKISDEILMPPDAYKTSGIENNNYLPATESAKLTFVEFGDFQCPACGAYHPLTKQLMTEYAGKINFVFRNFPLSQHKNAQISAQAVEAAGLQGKFWQMQDKVYETQSEWSDSGDPKSIFAKYAQDLGLNIDKFNTDIESQVIKDKIKRDQNDGTLAKLNATPTFYLNGVKIENLPGQYADLKALVENELSK